jgi:hypothetical protein
MKRQIKILQEQQFLMQLKPPMMLERLGSTEQGQMTPEKEKKTA